MNPLDYIGDERYLSYWQMLFSTLLNGFWAKTIAVICLFLAFWFGVRRQHLPLGLTFLTVSILLTYMSAVLRFFGLL